MPPIGTTVVAIWVVFGIWVTAVFLKGMFEEFGIAVEKAEPYPDTGHAGERKRFSLPHIELGWGKIALIWLLGYPTVQFVRHIF